MGGHWQYIWERWCVPGCRHGWMRRSYECIWDVLLYGGQSTCCCRCHVHCVACGSVLLLLRWMMIGGWYHDVVRRGRSMIQSMGSNRAQDESCGGSVCCGNRGSVVHDGVQMIGRCDSHGWRISCLRVWVTSKRRRWLAENPCYTKNNHNFGIKNTTTNNASLAMFQVCGLQNGKKMTYHTEMVSINCEF